MPTDAASEQVVPIIVVHAVTASGLHDHYPVDQERVWSPIEMAFKDYDRVRLFPSIDRASDQIRYESIEPSLVRASEVFGVVYGDLIGELKHNLSYGPVPVQPVYPFVYDWRQSNYYTIQRFAEFVDEVIDRTNLMPRTKKVVGALCECVDLVAHSMGGLVVSAAIARGLVGLGNKCKVRRVVTLGTPFRGANAAIAKLASGTGTLTGRDSSERERTMARVTPSVYQLLPSFPGAVVDSAGASLNIFDPDNFQRSVRRTLVEHVLEVEPTGAMTRINAEAHADTLFTQMLDTARKLHADVAKVDPAMLRPEGAWLAIVGAGEKTFIKTAVSKDESGETRFDLENGYSADTWDDTDQTGDETVPLAAARPPWKDAWKNTVVVKRQDFEWLGEMGDGFLQKRLGLHSTLPLLDLAQRWIINFFRPTWAGDKKLGQHGKLWGRGLPEFPGREVTDELQRVWSALIPGLKLRDAD